MVKQVLVGVLSVAMLAGCATGGRFSEVAPRGGWRAEAERACMDRRAGIVQTVSTGQSSNEERTQESGPSLIDNPSIVEIAPIIEDPCGIDQPLKVSAFVDGQTAVNPAATLGCPVTEALDLWMRESVQPAAIEWIGAPVIEIKQLSNYACRKRNVFGKGYSEHAFGNALDIAEFKFANGVTLTIAKNWDGSAREQGFLREIFATACQRFTTTLGPGTNALHYNHIHVDLAIIAPDKSPKLCIPEPTTTPPQRTPVAGEHIAAVRNGPPPTPETAAQEAATPETAAPEAAAPGMAPPTAGDAAQPGTN
jgi:hypothetical protein